jgi:hypothetical protein
VKRVTAADFPALRRVFAGYLHEDFPVEHGTPAAALEAFLEDADTTECRRFAKDARRFLARTAALEFAAVQELVGRLGSRWTPPSREALVALLNDAADRSSTSRDS